MTENDVARWIVMLCMAPTILGGLLITDGIFGFVLFKNLRALQAAKDWVSTRGTILASNTKVLKIPVGGGGKRGSRTNVPVVEYSYQVGGQSYKNNKLYAGHAFGGDKRQVVEKFLEQYPEGSSVEVFYNLNNPAESALHKNNPSVWSIAIVLIIVNLSMCGAIPLFWFIIGFLK
ncbi:MAG: DUF3592 domain-containing protein [Anaerolineales bacterium]|nr:MAG: DUF3592 domain-containing protein [Anaerolineales bacterium]